MSDLVSGSEPVITLSNFEKMVWSATKSTSSKERAWELSFTCLIISTMVLSSVGAWLIDGRKLTLLTSSDLSDVAAKNPVYPRTV